MELFFCNFNNGTKKSQVMKRILLIFSLVVSHLLSLQAQVSIEEITHEKRLHYKVTLSNATFFIDKFSGGISCIQDKNGNDWIGWKRLKEEKFPDSAAGDYRGFPNLVYGGADNGIGHPGFNKALCFKEDENRIRARSMNAKWEWQYTFYPKYVELQILQTPAGERNYWVLFEGIPGGEFNPEKQYWGTSNEIKSVKPCLNNSEEEYGKWKWVFFGHGDVPQVFFLMQKNNDNLADMFGYLGNSGKGLEAEDGMVVFGFGRDKNAVPLMNANQIFYLGFYDDVIDETGFPKLQKYIQKTFY